MDFLRDPYCVGSAGDIYPHSTHFLATIGFCFSYPFHTLTTITSIIITCIIRQSRVYNWDIILFIQHFQFPWQIVLFPYFPWSANNLSWTNTTFLLNFDYWMTHSTQKSTLCQLYILCVCIKTKQRPYCVEIYYFNPHFVSTHFPTIFQFLTPHSTPKSTQAGYSTFYGSRPPGPGMHGTGMKKLWNGC